MKLSLYPCREVTLLIYQALYIVKKATSRIHLKESETPKLACTCGSDKFGNRLLAIFRHGERRISYRTATWYCIAHMSMYDGPRPDARRCGYSHGHVLCRQSGRRAVYICEQNSDQ